MSRTMKPSTVLKKARKLIEAHWTRGTYARAANGRRVRAISPVACQFCALGAIRNACRSDNDDSEAAEFLREAIGGGLIHEFNDAQTNKRPVLALYDRAIKLAEQENR
jgi:hypothetical protein